MKKLIRYFLLPLLILLLLAAAGLYLRYGGGKPYPDISTDPWLPADSLHVFFQYDEPVGNVAASRDTGYPIRVFMTVHPESRPDHWKVLEITDGTPQPYPDEAAQQTLFKTVLGLYVDRQNRLWTIDHGNHGTGRVRLLAFELGHNRIVHDYTFSPEIAEKGSFFNDLCVSPDGRYVFVADVSFWAKKPSLVVYDTQTKQTISRLDGHPSLTNMGFVPVTPAKKMRFFGGLADLMPGIDGIDIDPQGQYVYYAAMSHDGLYRVPVGSLTDFGKSDAAIAASVERIATKPLSDGIRVAPDGSVLITDIEHQGIYRVGPDGKGHTLIKDARIRWADGLSLGSDGFWYLTDSDIPDQTLQSKAHMALHKPYFVYRFKIPDSELSR